MLDLLNKFISWFNSVSGNTIAFSGRVVIISTTGSDYSEFTFKTYDESLIIDDADVYLMKMKPISVPYSFVGTGTIPQNGYYGQYGGFNLKYVAGENQLTRVSQYYPIQQNSLGGFTGIRKSDRLLYQRLVPVAIITYNGTNYFFNLDFLYNFRQEVNSVANSSNTENFSQYFSLFNLNITQVRVTYGSCSTWDPPGNNIIIYSDVPGSGSMFHSTSQHCFRNDFIDEYYRYCLSSFKFVDASDVDKLTVVLTGNNDDFDNLVIINKIVNFYRSSPEGDIATNRGETVNLEFTAVYEDGSIKTPYTDVVYSDLPSESIAMFSGNSFTISENCRASIFTAIAKPNIGETSLYAFVQAKILNPVNPYLPDGGGVSGGGSQSGPSNVIGSFDGTPGPSVAGGIPDGAVGSDIASSGMYTKYLCDVGTLNVIAQYLWEDNVGIQALKAIIGNPIDSIISLISYPFALDSLVPVTLTKIYFGKYNSLLSANSITKSSIKIDWGTVEIPFFWGGFLDYSPYTQIQLYLPWGVGFVSLDPNEVMPWSPKNSYTQGSFTNGSVRVVTNIELDKGSCVHNVIGNNGRVIGSFGGICGKQVPVVGTNNAARTLALIGAAVSAGTTLGMTATGQPALGKGLAYGKNMSQMNRAEGREMLADYNSAVSGMLASSKAAAKSPPTYPRAGTFSDATSHLSVQYPYLIISRPSQSMPGQYGRFMGYPSNIFHNHLGEVEGYTEVSSIHLDNIPATSTELDELESILKGGVLL